MVGSFKVRVHWGVSYLTLPFRCFLGNPPPPPNKKPCHSRNDDILWVVCEPCDVCATPLWEPSFLGPGGVAWTTGAGVRSDNTVDDIPNRVLHDRK